MIDYEKFAKNAKLIVSLSSLGLVFLVVLALLLFAWFGKDFPPGVKETLLIVIGVVLGSYKETFGYWLGSSHGSERKTEMMGKGAMP